VAGVRALNPERGRNSSPIHKCDCCVRHGAVTGERTTGGIAIGGVLAAIVAHAVADATVATIVLVLKAEVI
jgi:hypothetical protein